MPSEKESMNMLIVSPGTKAAEFFTELSGACKCSQVSSVTTAGEAKRFLVDKPVDLLIINAPLSDDSGISLAVETAEKGSAGVLLVVQYELYQQISYKVEQYGILTLSKPISRQAADQSMKLLFATQRRIRMLQKKTAVLQEKIDEIRIINHAKWILADHLKMTEPEAHRYIEKQAMDTCQKRRYIAENLIKTYEI